MPSNYPESAVNNAKRAIKYKEENGSDCGTRVGWERASQISNRENLSMETVKRTFSFLSRAETYYTLGGSLEECGNIMYLAWGGKSMKSWAEKTINENENKSMITKDISLQIKDMDMKKGEVVKYVSAFDNVDAHGDIMVRGSYSKTLQENKNRIKMLFQHDVTNPIGKPLEMMEDEKGLLVRSYVSDLKNGDYRKLYEDGIITEHSVGFLPVKEEYDREQELNYIKEVKLFEYSAVTFGANENTPVVSMKSATKQEKDLLFNRLDTLTKAIRKGTYTDETFHLLEIELERIKSQIKALIVTDEPNQITQSNIEPLPDLKSLYNKLKN